MPKPVRESVPAALRREVFERDNHACHYCGGTERLSIDHKIPVSKGGPTVAENLLTACLKCNSRKSARSYEFVMGAKSANLVITHNHPASRYGYQVILDDRGDVMDPVTGVQAVRLFLGLSIVELATLCGVSPRTVEGWEQRGHSRVSEAALNVMRVLMRTHRHRSGDEIRGTVTVNVDHDDERGKTFWAEVICIEEDYDGFEVILCSTTWYPTAEEAENAVRQEAESLGIEIV